MPQDDDRMAMREAAPVSPDANGQAALLLVESLIHGLCEKAVITTDDAIAIVERALHVQIDRVDAAEGIAAVDGRGARAFLMEILASLQIDGSRDAQPG